MSLDDRDRMWRSRVMGGTRWTSHLPVAFVMLALVALVALPIVADRYVQPLNAQLRDIVEPARELVTTIHVQLALQGSAFHDFDDSGDSTLLQRYRQAQAEELAAQAALADYVRQLGDTVKLHFERMRALEQEWHRTVEALLSTRATREQRRLAATAEEDVFEDVLVAAADLDNALAGASRARRMMINEAEGRQRRLTILVGLVALAAVAGVAWLADRARVFAKKAETRRIQLERATESRARLMRGVSHDLKNPLSAIDGHASLLEDGIKGPLTASQRDSIGRIRRSVHALLGMITDLLELSKVESGHLTVQRRPTNVADVVRDAAEEHRDAAVAAGHDLRTEIADGMPMIQTDPDRVRQVLGNLLSNAVKYTPSGGHIVVRLEKRAGNGHARGAPAAAIDVIDSGPGIPPDKLDEVFEEFSRLETGKTAGTGLGLTIARRISRLLGGDISAASQAGQGATFTLWLPLDTESERPQAQRQPAKHSTP